ncbi:unnamed protein product, partial [Chrysoparadoxa australica]
PEHGYPILVGVASGFIITWAGFGVGMARKKYKIPYPQASSAASPLPSSCCILYSSNPVAFNCIQRAHQNCLENYPLFIMLLGISSVARPTAAAVLGGIRLAGFILYVKGYRTGDPGKRQRGAIGYIGLLGMIGLSLELAYRLITSD